MIVPAHAGPNTKETINPVYFADIFSVAHLHRPAKFVQVEQTLAIAVGETVILLHPPLH